jgi:hypothetical protein
MPGVRRASALAGQLATQICSTLTTTGDRAPKRYLPPRATPHGIRSLIGRGFAFPFPRIASAFRRQRNRTL